MKEYATKDVAEAAVLYMRGFCLQNYRQDNRMWIFQDPGEKIHKEVRLEIINRKALVEPLDFMEAVRRVKAFANADRGS